MKRSTPLKRTAMPPRTKAMPSRPLARLDLAGARTKAPAPKARLKSKEHPVSDKDKALWSRLAALGCIACMKDGRFNDVVSIHHCDGRTKPGCHERVLPLCAEHHQRDDTDLLQRIAIHPDKGRFEARYGTQAELMAECTVLLGGLS